MTRFRLCVLLLCSLVAHGVFCQDIPPSKKSKTLGLQSKGQFAPKANSIGACQISPMSLSKATDSYYNKDCSDALDQYRFSSDGPVVIEYAVSRVAGDVAALKEQGLISQTVTITIAAFDVDSNITPPEGIAPEHDRVRLNGHDVGFLSGEDG